MKREFLLIHFYFVDLTWVNSCNRKRIVFKNLVNAQPILFAINPDNRLNNDYCLPLLDYDAWDQERWGVNLQAYYEHKTIEVRIHEGTIDSKIINKWIELLLNIKNKDTVIDSNTFHHLNSFFKEFNINKELRSYIKRRLKKFSRSEKELKSILKVA